MPRVDEQQRGVVLHHERGRGHDVVALGGEEIEELLADVRGGRKHSVTPSSRLVNGA